MEALINIGIFLILMTAGYVFGKAVETKHYRSIIQREKALIGLPVVTLKRLGDDVLITDAKLVNGNVVISVDYFKKFLAGLRNLFGGRMSSYETLIDRARREAILRMKEEANGWDMVLNMRLATSSMNDGAKGSVSSIEVLAYGTAIKYQAAPAQKPAPAAATVNAPQVAARANATGMYRVTFSGKIAPGQQLETVKALVAALYKVPMERCESMFSGRTVVVKENVDRETALKYQAAFAKTGAICQIEPM